MTRWTYPTALTAPSHRDQEAVRRGVAWVQQQLLLGQQALVWAPGKRNLTYDRTLEAFAKANVSMTPRTRSSTTWRGGPALAAWPDADDLAQLAEDRRLTALCVIPHLLEDVSAWAEAAQPVQLGVPVQLGAEPGSASAAVPLDLVVVEGLKTLSVLVNHANQLAGTMDRRDAVAVLMTLTRAGYVLEPASVYRWAMTNGWPAAGAKRLREMAAQIRAGRTLRAPGLDQSLHPDILDQWRSAASGGGD